MPTYAYACRDCGHDFEVVQSFTDDSLTICPVCHGQLRKVFANVGVVFKGSGFYRNDSRGAGHVRRRQGLDRQGLDRQGLERQGLDDAKGSSDKGSGQRSSSGTKSRRRLEEVGRPGREQARRPARPARAAAPAQPPDSVGVPAYRVDDRVGRRPVLPAVPDHAPHPALRRHELHPHGRQPAVTPARPPRSGRRPRVARTRSTTRSRLSERCRTRGYQPASAHSRIGQLVVGGVPRVADPVDVAERGQVASGCPDRLVAQIEVRVDGQHHLGRSTAGCRRRGRRAAPGCSRTRSRGRSGRRRAARRPRAAPAPGSAARAAGRRWPARP